MLSALKVISTTFIVQWIPMGTEMVVPQSCLDNLRIISNCVRKQHLRGSEVCWAVWCDAYTFAFNKSFDLKCMQDARRYICHLYGGQETCYSQIMCVMEFILYFKIIISRNLLFCNVIYIIKYGGCTDILDICLWVVVYFYFLVCVYWLFSLLIIFCRTWLDYIFLIELYPKITSVYLPFLV